MSSLPPAQRPHAGPGPPRSPSALLALLFFALLLGATAGRSAAHPGAAAREEAPALRCEELCGSRAAAHGRCMGACTSALATCRAARARQPDAPGCRVAVARAEAGPARVPALPAGRPADLSLLDDEERAAVARADARAPALHRRPLVLHAGRPGVELEVTQTGRRFPFGFAVDLRRLRDPADLAFFGEVTRRHFDLAVTENSGKWRHIEPTPGARDYERFERDLRWAESQGFRVKGHTLLWGILPEVSGSGVPAWVSERFPGPLLAAPERRALRAILRRHVTDMVERYRGRVSSWDVANETLALTAQWYVRRLGDEIVADAFRWAREADPDATLVLNEWIVEVLKGPFARPTAEDVRDRVLELRARGVPVDAVGQQAHFAPAFALAGLPLGKPTRTPVDVYEDSLDALAETGLPVHITETSFIVPEEPELRAAHAEALMRLWWGHPAVGQVVFWGPWNAVAGLGRFEVGIWNDAGEPSRHGEAVLSLLNDRWRTAETRLSGPAGRAALSAHHGDYVVEWSARGRRVHARFRVEEGPGAAHVVLLPPEPGTPRGP